MLCWFLLNNNVNQLCACMLSYFSRVRLFVIPWTVVCQAPLSMGFSKQENWNGLPFPSPGDLPHPGIEPVSLTSLSPALAEGFLTTSATWEALNQLYIYTFVSILYTCTDVSPPSWASLPYAPPLAPHTVGPHRALRWAPCADSSFPLALVSTWSCMHLSVSLSVRPGLFRRRCV